MFLGQVELGCDVAEREHLMKARIEERLEEDAAEERTRFDRRRHARHLLLQQPATELHVHTTNANLHDVTHRQDDVTSRRSL